MSWRNSKLDNIAFISNSDSHSLERIGREANIFDCDLSYKGIMDAIKDSRIHPSALIRADIDPRLSAGRLAATVEFFPEEGKYHYDGHRLCNVRWDPVETKRAKGICSKCGKRVTVGVMNRVDQLADRPPIAADTVKLDEALCRRYNERVPYMNLVTLDEIVGEAFGVGPKTKSVKTEYDKLIKAFGSEFIVLTKAPARDLMQTAKAEVVEGIERVRQGKVEIAPGYDGEYGKIKIFGAAERKEMERQSALF